VTALPARVQHLFLARHGRTALEAQDRVCGRADPCIDTVGISEAEALGNAMVAQGVACVVSSPLQRARQTAHIVALAIGAPEHVDDDLTDRAYGPHTGLRHADVEASWTSIDRAPGAEPLSLVRRRTTDVLNRLLDAPGMDAVLVVTHDALIRAFLTPLAPEQVLTAPTGSWAWCARRGREWALIAADQRPGGRVLR